MLLLDWLRTSADMSSLHQFFATFYIGCQSKSGSSSRLLCSPSPASVIQVQSPSMMSARHSQTFLGVPVCELLIQETFLCHKLKRRLAVEVFGSQRHSLPLHLHDQTLSDQQFQSGLKIHLLKLAYQRHLSSENYSRMNLLSYLLTRMYLQENVKLATICLLFDILLNYYYYHHLLLDLLSCFLVLTICSTDSTSTHTRQCKQLKQQLTTQTAHVSSRTHS